MVVVPLPNPPNNSQIEPAHRQSESSHWIRVVAGTSLLLGGVLLLNGKRRPALVAAASGTALALLDQQETVRTWWRMLPALIDDAERGLNKVENIVGDIVAQREKLRSLLRR
jgi:hypothetical protein